jgi:hypothetical protein
MLIPGFRKCSRVLNKMKTVAFVVLAAYVAFIVGSAEARSQPRADYYTDPDPESSGKPFFIDEPENVTTRLGQRVILGCRVGNVNSSASVQWTRDDFGLGTKDLITDWPNMRIVENNPDSKFYL